MKVILTIAAGRRLTMSGLIPQLLAQEGWDELHVWVNSQNYDDTVFLSKLPALDSRIKLKFLDQECMEEYQDAAVFAANTTGHLASFWPKNCTDPDAIYVRFDDDIVFVEQGTVKALVEARLKYPEPYLIFPVIINNGVMAHHLEKHGKIKNPQYESYTPYVFDTLVWSADMCFDIHEQFINGARQHGVEHFHVPDVVIDPQHISINCMVYFGKDIAQWGGEFDINGEEGYITCQIPYWNKRPLMIMGSKVVSHFAFHTQRANWEGPTDDEDVKMYVGQKVTIGEVTSELQAKFNEDEIFREAVKKRADCWNHHLQILELYRDLCLDLYDVYSFPIQHDTWDWAQIQQDITIFKKHKNTSLKEQGQSTISTL